MYSILVCLQSFNFYLSLQSLTTVFHLGLLCNLLILLEFAEFDDRIPSGFAVQSFIFYMNLQSLTTVLHLGLLCNLLYFAWICRVWRLYSIRVWCAIFYILLEFADFDDCILSGFAVQSFIFWLNLQILTTVFHPGLLCNLLYFTWICRVWRPYSIRVCLQSLRISQYTNRSKGLGARKIYLSIYLSI